MGGIRRVAMFAKLTSLVLPSRNITRSLNTLQTESIHPHYKTASSHQLHKHDTRVRLITTSPAAHLSHLHTSFHPGIHIHSLS